MAGERDAQLVRIDQALHPALTLATEGHAQRVVTLEKTAPRLFNHARLYSALKNLRAFCEIGVSSVQLGK
jgi:hypothetical protein